MQPDNLKKTINKKNESLPIIHKQAIYLYYVNLAHSHDYENIKYKYKIFPIFINKESWMKHCSECFLEIQLHNNGI